MGRIKHQDYGDEDTETGTQYEDDDMEERLTALFAQQSTITHMDVSYAFGQTLTRSRISALLRRLVGEGRLIQEGRGAQTRYRAAPGQFGK